MVSASLYPSEPITGSCLASVPFSSEECPPSELLKSLQNEDEFLVIGSVGVAFTTVAVTAAKKLSGAILERTLSRFMDRGEKVLAKIWPPPLTAEKNLIFETLYNMSNFEHGVALLMEGWSDLSPADAVRHTFEFLYRYDPRHPLANTNPHIITANDVTDVMERYGLNATQIYNIARLVDDEFGWGRDVLWNDIYRALFDARYHGVSEHERPDDIITDTQKIFLKEMMLARIAEERNVLSDTLYELSEAIASKPSSKSDAVNKVALGQFEIAIDTTPLRRSLGRVALIGEMEQLAAKLEGTEPLNTVEEAFILKLKADNPVLQKVIDARTNSTDTVINGTNLAIRMTERALLGEYSWFRQILGELRGVEGTFKASIIVYEENGTVTKYNLVYNVPGLARGTRIALYAEGEPYPVGPFTFEVGRAFIVRNGSVNLENAIVVSESPTRNFYILEQDIQHLRSIAEEIRSDPSLSRTGVGRAFLRFFNRLQALARAAYGEDFKIEPGSPQAKIERLAKQLVRENWTIEFEQRLDFISEEFGDIEALAARQGKGNQEAFAFIKGILQMELNKVRTAHMKQFKTGSRRAVSSSLKKLEAAILGGDVAAKNEAVDGLKKLAAKQVPSRHMDELSTDLYGETSAWLTVRKADELREYAKAPELPENLRYAVVARGVDRTKPPSLTRARAEAGKGNYDTAFFEYDRIAADRKTKIGEKIIAQAEKARLAVVRHQFPRAWRAKVWIMRMKARGHEIPSEAQVILDKLPPLNSGRRVIITGKKRTATAKAVVKDSALDEASVTPRYIRTAAKTYEVARDIGSPAVRGALTFIAAGEACAAILPHPATHLEAVIYGYDVMTTATAVEKGTEKLADHFIGLRNIAMPQKFSVSRFTGGLGSSMLLYKVIAGGAEKAGAPPKVAEFTGLAGTGIVLSGWKPAVAKIFKRETAARLIRAGEKFIPGVGQVFFALDAVPSVMEGIYDEIGDSAPANALNQWYEHKIAEYSAYRLFPTSYVKMMSPFMGQGTDDELARCRWMIKNGRNCY